MSDGGALTAPVAGWYPDRNESNTVRWWDGQQWTDQTQSVAPAAAAFEQPVSMEAFGFVRPVQNPVAQNPVAQNSVTGPDQIVPGWYSDNADPSTQRWWDGRQWTAHTTPTVAVAQATPGYVGETKNTTATLALLLSIVSFAGLIFAPILLVAGCSIVMGIVALRRARRYRPGAGRRGQAIASIVIGAFAFATIVLAVAALNVSQQLHSSIASHNATGQSGTQSGTAPGDSGIFFPSTVAEMKQKIAESVAQQDSVTVKTVTCDGAASMVAGSRFQCGVIVDDGRWALVQVQIGYPAESGMSYDTVLGPLMSSDSTMPPQPYTVDGITQQLTVNLQQTWGSPVSDITCEASASTAQGSHFQCGITLQDGRVGLLLITMVNPGGYDVSVIQSPAGSSGSSDSSDPALSNS